MADTYAETREIKEKGGNKMRRKKKGWRSGK